MSTQYLCPAFSLSIQGRDLILASDLKLQSGDVCVVFGKSDLLLQEFLYMLAGLHRIRALTMPANSGYGRQPSTAAVPNITLSGIPIYELSIQQRAADIAIIYENPEVAIIGRTVADEFRYSFAACEIAPPFGAAMALEPYGLQYKIERDTDTLSGGERHRLNCACALEVKPKLIIADFTASNLDSDFFDIFLTHLGKFAKNGGIVIVAGVRVDQMQLLQSNAQILIYNNNTSTLFEAKVPPIWAIDPKIETQLLQTALGTRTPNSETKLKADGLFLSGRTQLRYNVSVKSGDFWVCKAPNGFGKTTIANILSRRITKYDGILEAACKRVTLAVQHPERSLLQSSVKLTLNGNQIITGICGFSKEEIDGHPRELCRAKQKLLSIAVSLASSDGVVILDEPTCGMDMEAKERLARLIALFPSLGVIVFTHDPALTGIGTTLNWE